ncbi:MAG: SH3 domain-containing protein [Treponema sp.]|nr:SH3 domain-containing protein [Treponema sp.]
MRNGGTYNEGKNSYIYDEFMDQYGNIYELSSDGKEYFVDCDIQSIPDMKVLLSLKKHIKELFIWDNSPITDITFLENFQQLKSLYILNSNISNFEPLGKLASLDVLGIYNEHPVDCSIFVNLEYLDSLVLSTDRIINLEAVFDKSHGEFKLPKLSYIGIGEYEFIKNALGSLMSKTEGLTPKDKNSREKYGNKDGENFIDQYGNRFYCKTDKDGISVEIIGAPDTDVLLQLKNHITNLNFSENSRVTDISFLRDFSYLKELRVIKPNILTLKSMDSLSNLGSLSIDLTVSKKILMENGYKGITDFLLLFKSHDKLNRLTLIDEDIKNEEKMYILAQEVFKISGIEILTINGISFDKDYKISFEFKSGAYRILQYNANVRTAPDRNSKVIEVLNLHDEIEIMENTFVEEKINNVWGFWYKIKHGDVSGYTFGGNIAYRAFETDIDKNGVKDYFYFRFSTAGYGVSKIEPNDDVFIYINRRKINTNVLSETKRYFEERPFDWCRFEDDDGCVLVGLIQEGRHQYEYQHIFKVTPDGKIEFVTNWNEIDYW